VAIARISFAAATISIKAFFVSSQCLVFKPQSGLTQSWSTGITAEAFSKNKTQFEDHNRIL
jgi:hypothetical protein